MGTAQLANIHLRSWVNLDDAINSHHTHTIRQTSPSLTVLLLLGVALITTSNVTGLP